MQRIGGKHVEISGLMGPGIDPHLFRAAPADNTKLQEARPHCLQRVSP